MKREFSRRSDGFFAAKLIPIFPFSACNHALDVL